MRRLLLLLIATCAVGCASSERKKYDAWFAPGSSRQQIIAQYGKPSQSYDRPSAHPINAEWVAALGGANQWMHPGILVDYIHEVEAQNLADVARIDRFYLPSHRSFLEKLDFFNIREDLVFYDGSDRVISSRPLPYYAYGD